MSSIFYQIYYRKVIADASQVAGAGEGAAGFFPAVTVSFKETGRGEDSFFGPQAFEERAAVDLFPFALEFDGAGRRLFPRCSFDPGGGDDGVVEIAYGNYSGDAGGLQRIRQVAQAVHGEAASVIAPGTDFRGVMVYKDAQSVPALFSDKYSKKDVSRGHNGPGAVVEMAGLGV